MDIWSLIFQVIQNKLAIESKEKHFKTPVADIHVITVFYIMIIYINIILSR